jgi:hypothetical protein
LFLVGRGLEELGVKAGDLLAGLLGEAGQQRAVGAVADRGGDSVEPADDVGVVEQQGFALLDGEAVPPREDILGRGSARRDGRGVGLVEV